MDVLAHGLWAAAAARKLNEKRGKPAEAPLSFWRTAFWGIFPDLFAFTPLLLWFGYGLLNGSIDAAHLPEPQSLEPASPDTLAIMHLVNFLYSLSHSLPVFALVVASVWFFRKYVLGRNTRWTDGVFLEMGGWLLHVLIDVPTHTYEYFPTPLLWPVSSWRFKEGISWHLPWFMVINYSALALIYLRFWWKSRRVLKPAPVPIDEK